MLRYSNQGQTISINLNDDYQIYAMARWDKKSSLYIAEMYISKKETNSFLHFINSFTISCERMDLFMTLTKEISEMYSNTGFSDEISEYENIVNLWLGLDVWDYSGLPGNILGQTCPQFALLFLPLSAIAIIVDDFVRWKWFDEEKPRYKWR